MAKILLDGTDRSTEFASAATVTSVFESLRDEVQGLNRVVVNVEVDGKPLVWEDGCPEWEWPHEKARSLSFTTDDPYRMSKSLLDLLREHLPPLRDQLTRAAQLLRKGSTPEGVKIILEAMPWWQQLQIGIINVCKLHGIDYEQPQYAKLGIAPAFEQLTRLMGEFNEAAELQDYLLLADILEFEFAPATETWKQLCDALDQAVVEAKGALANQ